MVHDRQAMAESIGLIHVMRGDQHGHAVFAAQ
jgi:hypothetical protein